jgi:hypothetical protein
MDALRTKERQALRKRQYEEWQQSEQSALGSPRLRPVHPLASAAGSDHKIENEGDVTPPHSRQVSPLNRPHTSPSSPGMVKLTEEEQAAQTGLFIYEEEYQSCGRGRVPVTPAPAESPPSSARKSIGLTRIEMTARLMPVDTPTGSPHVRPSPSVPLQITALSRAHPHMARPDAACHPPKPQRPLTDWEVAHLAALRAYSGGKFPGSCHPEEVAAPGGQEQAGKAVAAGEDAHGVLTPGRTRVGPQQASAPDVAGQLHTTRPGTLDLVARMDMGTPRSVMTTSSVYTSRPSTHSASRVPSLSSRASSNKARRLLGSFSYVTPTVVTNQVMPGHPDAENRYPKPDHAPTEHDAIVIGISAGTKTGGPVEFLPDKETRTEGNNSGGASQLATSPRSEQMAERNRARTQLASPRDGAAVTSANLHVKVAHVLAGDGVKKPGDTRREGQGDGVEPRRGDLDADVQLQQGAEAGASVHDVRGDNDARHQDRHEDTRRDGAQQALASETSDATAMCARDTDGMCIGHVQNGASEDTCHDTWRGVRHASSWAMHMLQDRPDSELSEMFDRDEEAARAHKTDDLMAGNVAFGGVYGVGRTLKPPPRRLKPVGSLWWFCVCACVGGCTRTYVRVYIYVCMPCIQYIDTHMQKWHTYE